MKIHTSSRFTDLVGDEFSWRRKELIDYRLTTRTSNAIVRPVLIRAGVPLAYAHWEGFVKNGTELLLNFVSNQKLANKDLADPYFTHSVKSQIAQVLDSTKVITISSAACFIRDAADKTADIRYKNYVNTESNLSSAVFDQIATSVGIDTIPYRYLYPYIDESIVNSRNKIAHGEHLQITPDDFHALVDRVADLIRMYKGDLENLVALKRFRH